MGRFEILKTKKIRAAIKDVVTKPSKNLMTSFNTLDELGQYKSITVCQVGKHYLVVDGNKYFKSLKEQGLSKILCFNLGPISRERYLLYRLLFNVNQQRLDYIGIAEMITELADVKVKESTISNLTGIPIDEVKRYSTLLKFDWDEFNRIQFNNQINPFEDER